MFRPGGQGGQAHLGGMAGAELFFLKGEDDIPVIARKRPLNVSGLMTHDDDDGPGARFSRRGHDVADHGFPADRMQHFRQSGSHALALAGCKDDGGEPIASWRQKIYLRREGKDLVSPNSWSFLLSVLRLTPKICATCVRFPPASRSTSSIRGFSTLRMVCS